jgi:hypothetical protein
MRNIRRAARVALPVALPVALHVVLHAAVCFVLALALGWLELQIRITAGGRNAANEFVGMYFVLWIYFIGPVSCLFAAPAHVLSFVLARNRAHIYSVCASGTICAATWVFVYGIMSRASTATSLPQ